MNCSKCGGLLLEAEKFCIRCGTAVDRSADPEPEPERAPPAEVRCDACGETLKADDRFCQACGAQVGGPAISERPASRLQEPVEAEFEGSDGPVAEPITPHHAGPPTEKRSNNTLYVLLGFAFVLIAGVFFAYDYMSTPRSQELQPLPPGQAEIAQSTTDSASGSPFGGFPTPAPPEQEASDSDTSPAPRYDPPTSPRAEETPKPASRPVPAGTPPTQADSPGTSQEVAAGRLALLPSQLPDPPASPFPGAPSPQPSPAQPTNTLPSAQPLPPAAKSTPPRQPAGEVLRPGSQAWKRADPPPRATTPAPAAAPPPRAPAPKEKGTIYWMGKLEKNQVIVIENGQANFGAADGDHFTGIPIDVHLPSPAVQLVERPTAQNNWNRVAFRCLRNTKQSVTINIQWNLLR